MDNIAFVKVMDKHNQVYLYPINRIKRIRCFNHITDEVSFEGENETYSCVDAKENKKYGEKVSFMESIVIKKIED